MNSAPQLLETINNKLSFQWLLIFYTLGLLYIVFFLFSLLFNFFLLQSTPKEGHTGLRTWKQVICSVTEALGKLTSTYPELNFNLKLGGEKIQIAVTQNSTSENLFS